MNDFSLDDFLDDFLQEANEHLQSINQNLLVLERIISSEDRLVETTHSMVSIINELFRSFHTIKGLSGMVGLRPAEELSHLMESVLREIQQSKLEINQEAIDLLFEGTKTLSATVTTLANNGEQAVDITQISNSLALLLQNQPAETSPSLISEEISPSQSSSIETQEPVEVVESTEEDIFTIIDRSLDSNPEIKALLDKEVYHKIQSAHQAGYLLYLVIFTPSAEKAERGKNVSQLQEQLGDSGSILKSIPLIQKESVRFAFFVSRSKPLPVEVFQEAEVTPLKGAGSVTIQPDEKPEIGPDSRIEEISYVEAPHPASSSVRVDLGKLDEILRIVSEMVVVKSRLNDQVDSLSSQYRNGGGSRSFEILEQSMGQLDRNLRDLRIAVTGARMVPLAEVFNHMPLAVRDLTRAQNKEVRLVLEGEHTQIDKVMVDRLLDPLLHLVRNAITHGIESPAERIAAGKTPVGSLVLRGAWEGDHILIELADDGRGIDLGRVKEKAVELGLLKPDQAVDEGNLIDILASHGFSTLEEAHFGAGRGIGMEVVVRNVRSVGGTTELHSTPGTGTVFRLLMPLTLTILDAIIARVGSERYAIPRHSVEEVIEIDPEDVVEVESGELLSFRQAPLTLIRLSDIFQITGTERGSRQFGLICCSSERRAALVVDQLLGLREVVVRAVQDPLVSLPGIFGATDLGDGRAVLILDVPPLLFQSSK
jgi:two-component system, chemotaxis family, sensor kinase CheA